MEFSYEEWVESLMIETAVDDERQPGWFDLGQIRTQLSAKFGKPPCKETVRKRLQAQVDAGKLLTALVYDRQKGCTVRVWKPKEPVFPPTKAE